jgi:hypothetical protein
MMYYLSRALPVFSVLFVLGGIACTIAGIFIDGGENEPWGELAFLLYVITAGSFVGYAIWEEGGLPEKPIRLSRDGRKELRKRQERAILEQSIRDLEAKLRDDA